MWESMRSYMRVYDWGHMLFGGLMMFLFLAGFIALVILLVLRRSRDIAEDADVLQRSSQLEILRERYARGELDKQQFEKLERELMH
ncbi:putative membrane protein [Modicisalibacter ilicicola DSM 19980]|uniref:Putative membrane protein n=1 Tax=Modicisalibacter ilicicola DSM 19980 TaxID=1121942 RepID=A0A1M5BBU1_9GAMM|nr:SHOCT domain-containing protein [Halomonas ilicicola]SHF40041.1 putative membrane protein [Halomonas ilicicola DSM 19980]